MNEKTGYKIIALLTTVIVVLAAVTTFIYLNKTVETKEIIKEIEIKSIKYSYDVTWTKHTVDMSQEDISKNFLKFPFFFDGKKFPRLIDGTYQFFLDFNIPEKFVKEVTINISWNDRFNGPLSLTGRDELHVDICTPVGGMDTVIIEMPYLNFLFKLSGGPDLEKYDYKKNLNECPPDMKIDANNSDEAIYQYWQKYDILEYNKGHSGEWELYGESHMGEKRIVRRVRNILRNTVLNLILGNPVDIEVSYTYYNMNIIDLGEVG
jgi:hypothetical protein